MKAIKYRTDKFQVTKGIDLSKEELLVVPDQSLSLQEILDRFTRGEDLPIGQGVAYGEDEDMDNPLNVDLEKMAEADLVDKEEYSKRLQEIVDRYNASEKGKADKARKEKEEKALQEEVEKRLKEAQKKAESPPSSIVVP